MAHAPSNAAFYALETYQETTAFLRQRLPAALQCPQFGIVCGSGLGGLVDELDPATTVTFDYKDIPHFAVSTVQGHKGQLVFGMLGDKPTVCMVGRHHMYEGHALIRTVFPIRVMKLLGVSVLIVSNAAGGLNRAFRVGDIMILADHINVPGMGGANPLVGPNLTAFGPRFPPVSHAYDFDLRIAAVKAARAAGIDPGVVHEGVYCMVQGPSYETRAEARWLLSMGGDAVGMSTVPEVIIAKHAGMRVLGVSLITNVVAVGRGRSAIAAAIDGAVEGAHAVQDDELLLATHEEVLASVQLRGREIQALVRHLVVNCEAQKDVAAATAP
ncbi:hypothetical protein CXG81DRAFT_11713 [Caulochytrium protostelioides]|uniref:Purine nucleoside phosphorylase n=1 Tax=Caulochytrium protostelioides TaxID=1555241 RepID=A0A4P9X9A8_9FUNG|nr:hypothetical protein CXG81DRAFT_11713 [Caulochytrium protostelioides]|eukprot:RKP01660.1 hypothetical protein CXG81DRAFT_11713 [Caulochytrium protostelioides]